MELKIARQIRGFSQAQLAEASGLEQATISRFEVDRRAIYVAKYETVLRLCRALNVHCDDLFPASELEEIAK